MASTRKIAEVISVAVCLLLEGDGHIAFEWIEAVARQTVEPFDYIYDIERQEQQFPHLAGMDHLMVEQFGGDFHIVFHEQYPEQVYSPVVAAQWDNLVSNDSHACRQLVLHLSGKGKSFCVKNRAGVFGI